MKFGYLIVAISFIASCKKKASPALANQTSKEVFLTDTILDLYQATIMVPKGWQRLIDDDSVPKIADATPRYRFYNGNKKLVKLEYGLSSIIYPAEPFVVSPRWRRLYIQFKVDTSNIMFSDNPELIQLRKKRPYTYSILNISGFEAMYYRPKQIGYGLTGIFIDSIGHIGHNIAGLNFYANDLDSLETREMTKVIMSLQLSDFN